MNEFITPHDDSKDDAFRDSVYRGTVFRLPPCRASQRLVTIARERIEHVLGEDFRRAQFDRDPDDFFRMAGRLRRELYLSPSCRNAVAELLVSIGSDPAEHVCDPARLRVVTVGGHHNPAAAPVYYAHRDTWYSNPQTQITWWLPLHEVNEQETFEFLPDCFGRAVDNDSEGFDYDRWTSGGPELKIGWQDAEAGKREMYPRLREPLDQQRRIRFAADPGEVIVFSGQHLHQTIPIESGLTRFSIDFRTVHLGDHGTGAGPPNVDNRSTGDALVGHVPLVAGAAAGRCDE